MSASEYFADNFFSNHYFQNDDLAIRPAESINYNLNYDAASSNNHHHDHHRVVIEFDSCQFVDVNDYKKYGGGCGGGYGKINFDNDKDNNLKPKIDPLEEKNNEFNIPNLDDEYSQDSLDLEGLMKLSQSELLELTQPNDDSLSNSVAPSSVPATTSQGGAREDQQKKEEARKRGQKAWRKFQEKKQQFEMETKENCQRLIEENRALKMMEEKMQHLLQVMKEYMEQPQQ